MMDSRGSFMKIIYILVITFLLSLCGYVGASFISKDGGYDIVVSIEDSTPVPRGNVEQYISNITNAFQQLSTRLYLSTQRRFYIRSVDILLPSAWETNAEIAVSQAYSTSDFRISDTFKVPRVENPNLCGSAGQYIELPTNFFHSARYTDLYGESSNALLNLFARYRYGVWEEHGHFDDSNSNQFPYFNIQPSLNPSWQFTGCSKTIKGKYVDENGEDKQCDLFSKDGPSDKCRFKPSGTNTVDSSLTYLPWAYGVSQFCNHDSHNYAAPNRHNLFCGHHSISHVISESEDFFTLRGPLPDDDFKLIVPTIRTFKVSQKPLLYILLDTGRTSTKSTVLNEVSQSLLAFLRTTVDETNPDIVTAIGTYPHSNAGRNHYYVKEEAEWSTVKNGLTNFTRVLDSVFEHPDGPVIRDFGEAIKEVVEKIKVRNHKAGAIILMVKRGATQNGFQQLTYFGDVLSSIRQQSNLQLHVIEFQQNEQTPYTNLQPLVAQANGQHFVVAGTESVTEKLKPFFNEISENLNKGLEAARNDLWTIYKTFVPINEEGIEIPIIEGNLATVTLCLTTTRYIPEKDIQIRQKTGGVQDEFVKIRRNEWNEDSDTSRRTVDIYTITNPTKDSVWEVRVANCTSTLDVNCLAFLTVNAEGIIEGALDKNKISSSDLKINVFTSAENNYFDHERIGAKIVPFSIFAQIEFKDQRVLSLDYVFATIVFNNQKSWTVQLFDDGTTLPDVSRDGIYSGVFSPNEDGTYKIYVTVNHINVANEILEDEQPKTVYLLGQLLATDQSQFGCVGSDHFRCLSAPITRELATTEDLTSTVYVAHSITFLPRPLKIMDFTVTTFPGYIVKFGFTSPRILGEDFNAEDEEAQPDEFHIFVGSKIEDFLDNNDKVKQIAVINGEAPGKYIDTEEYNVTEEIVVYFAVEAVYKDQKSGPSNIVGVLPTESGSPPDPIPTSTTTTTTTTTTPTTTSTTTTRETTRISTSSTVKEDRTTPEATTTKRPSASGSHTSKGSYTLSVILLPFVSFIFYKF